MVTLAEAHRAVSSEIAPAALVAPARASVLRMGVSGRLIMAGAAIALLWSAIALGLA
ncbi:hypothetical protein [Enterovirga sp.]|uniref:hypothetical protein n=1 Tax=Enterovirga sp. TaxID=2026350 RepID=UPI002CC4ECE2|nr:hypothetical protein [Enterovirga sp.]HMO28168.1 hypothetical protein [Enterovirga sp.]